MSKQKEAKLYTLGPQPDKAVIIRIPDDFHLMVLRKAVEKQEKNAQAATGTISALAEGDDELLDSTQRALSKLKNIIAGSRAPENQIADTPIGKELEMATKAALAGEPQEPIDGRPGEVWAPHVPKPRPKLGDVVVFADHSKAKIIEAVSWEADGECFGVQIEREGGEGGRMLVIAHVPQGDSEQPYVWRIRGALYTTPTIAPSAGPLPEESTDKISITDMPADSPALAHPKKKRERKPKGSSPQLALSKPAPEPYSGGRGRQPEKKKKPASAAVKAVGRAARQKKPRRS